MLISSIIWQCELTGRPNLTYEEALASEKAARKMLRDYPKAVRGPVILVASQTKRSALSELIDDVYNYVKDHYFKDEEVDVINASGKGCRFCKIIEVIDPNQAKKDSKSPAKSPNKSPDPFKIQYKVQAIDDKKEPQIWTVKGDSIRRDKSIFTKDRTKLFLKQHVELVKGMLKIKDDSYKKFVTDQNLTLGNVFIGKVPSFELSKTLAKVQEKKDATKGKKKESMDGKTTTNKKAAPSAGQKKKAAASKQGDITKYLNSSGGPSKKQETAEEKKKKEENAKKLKEDMERMRKEKAEKEAEIKRKLEEEKAQLLAKTQALLREVNQIRDDLELTDQRIMPKGKPVMSMIGEKFFGDFMHILEFLHSFPEVLSIRDKFPQGVTMDILERALIMKEINGPLSDIIQVLLSTIFSLQMEEENDIEIQYRVNGDSVSLKHPKIEGMQNATRVQRWSGKHYCTKINELVMDSMTISELLRLHFLASGAILSDKCARYRFQQRGGYQSSDDPGLDFCNKFPHILRTLKQYTIFELPLADIIRVIKCLIEQILTYSSVRELIEDRLETSAKAKIEYKVIKAAERKRELKINEEKKNVKEDMKQKMMSYDGKPEEQGAFVKQLEKEVEDKLSKIEIRSQSEKEKYLKDLNACTVKFFDYQSFLGLDRAFRSYYIFESLPGLFVEHQINYASGECLTQTVKHNAELAKCTYDQRYAVVKHMVMNELKNEDKENKTNNSKEVPPKKVNGAINGDSEVIKKDETIAAEISQNDLSMCSANPEDCIVHTKDHPNRVSWTYYNTEEEITELIKSLNPRGYREKNLKETMEAEKDLILNYIQDCPIEKLSVLPEEKDSKMKEIVKRHFKKYDYANLNLEPGTDPTTIYDVAIRENILDFETKITLGCLGNIKVSDRIEWRRLIENFNYDKLTDSLSWGTQAWKMNGGLTNGHSKEENGDESGGEEEQEPEEEEIDDEIEEGFLPGIEIVGNTTVLESEDSSDEGISLHDSDALKTKVQNMASALLQIEQGIDQKFIRAPFGPKKDSKDKNAQTKALFHCKKRIQKWENSLMKSTNFSQASIRINSFSNQILI